MLNIIKSKIAEKAIKILDQQVAKGLDNYGHTLDNNMANIPERIGHIQEELADALQYSIWLNNALQDQADTLQEFIQYVEQVEVDKDPQGRTLNQLKAAKAFPAFYYRLLQLKLNLKKF